MYFSWYINFFQKIVSCKKLSRFLKATNQFRDFWMLVPTHKNCIPNHSSSAFWDLHFLLLLLSTSAARARERAAHGKPGGRQGHPRAWLPRRPWAWEISPCVFPPAGTARNLWVKFNQIIWWVGISNLNEMFPALPKRIFFYILNNQN